jgi:hypothetical protein
MSSGKDFNEATAPPLSPVLQVVAQWRCSWSSLRPVCTLGRRQLFDSSAVHTRHVLREDGRVWATLHAPGAVRTARVGLAS